MRTPIGIVVLALAIILSGCSFSPATGNTTACRTRTFAPTTGMSFNVSSAVGKSYVHVGGPQVTLYMTAHDVAAVLQHRNIQAITAWTCPLDDGLNTAYWATNITVRSAP